MTERSCAGDLKSVSVLSRGSIISKRPYVFECIHVTCALKHNTRMIRLYRTRTVTKDPSNANWVTLIVKLHSVTIWIIEIRNVSSFNRTPRSMYGQVSNNEHVTPHHLTRLNVEFADLIATCNKDMSHFNFHDGQMKKTIVYSQAWIQLESCILYCTIIQLQRDMIYRFMAYSHLQNFICMDTF